MTGVVSNWNQVNNSTNITRNLWNLQNKFKRTAL